MLFYLLIAIVLVSGLSTWLSAGLNVWGHASPRDVALSAITYVVGILTTATVDLLIDASSSGEARIAILLIAVLTLGLLLGLMIPMLVMPGASSGATEAPKVWLKLLAVSVPGWVIWWMVNGGDKRYADTTNAAAAAGGNPMQGLQP